MPGNIDDARLIYDWLDGGDERPYGRSERVTSQQAPEGWRFLGSGSNRSVWRSPDGVAYKVEHNYRYDDGGNRNEYNNLLYAQTCELPVNVRLPGASLYEVYEGRSVIAMELINGPTLWELCQYTNEDTEALYGALSICEHDFDLFDLHDENCIVEKSTGYLVPVDLGG